MLTLRTAIIATALVSVLSVSATTGGLRGHGAPPPYAQRRTQTITRQKCPIRHGENAGDSVWPEDAAIRSDQCSNSDDNGEPLSSQKCRNIKDTGFDCDFNENGDMVCPMCKCVLKYDSNGSYGAGWVHYGEKTFAQIPTDGGGDVKAAFLGNIVGHAKMLCKIINGVDCLKKGIKTQGDDVIFIHDEETGKEGFVHAQDVFGIVHKICGVIDGGLSKLPELIPELIGGVIPGLNLLPGIPGLLKKVIGIFTGGKNPFKEIGKKIGDFFGGIFSTSNAICSGQIQIFSTEMKALDFGTDGSMSTSASQSSSNSDSNSDGPE